MVRKSMWIGALLLAVTMTPMRAPVRAQTEEPRHKPVPKAKLADFAWMAGRWKSEMDANILDVTYMGPDTGVITGMLVVHRADRIYMVELSSFVQTVDGVSLFIRHFSPELQAWEKGDPIVLKLASFDGKAAEFDNPVSSDPKRAIITRNSEDSFTAHSDVYDEKGQHQVIEFTYTRVK